MTGPTGDFRTIDLGARRTESEWGKTTQAFVERATAAWFDWLGWILVTGAIAFVARTSGNIILKVLQGISLALLWSYFQFFIMSIRVEPYTTRAYTSDRKIRYLWILLSLTLSLALILGCRWLINDVVETLAISPPN